MNYNEVAHHHMQWWCWY